MTTQAIQDQAAYLYDACEEVAVAPNGDRWAVFDGPGGPLVDTVDKAVLHHLDDNYDLPVWLLDGTPWITAARA